MKYQLKNLAIPNGVYVVENGRFREVKAIIKHPRPTKTISNGYRFFFE